MAMLAAASITVCSVKIRLAIQLVSSASWNPEAESFSKYLNDDPTYFDGCGFFFLTRQLVLGVSVALVLGILHKIFIFFQMAASVVTYEIYLRELVDVTAANTEFICRKK